MLDDTRLEVVGVDACALSTRNFPLVSLVEPAHLQWRGLLEERFFGMALHAAASSLHRSSKTVREDTRWVGVADSLGLWRAEAGPPLLRNLSVMRQRAMMRQTWHGKVCLLHARYHPCGHPA